MNPLSNMIKRCLPKCQDEVDKLSKTIDELISAAWEAEQRHQVELANAIACRDEARDERSALTDEVAELKQLLVEAEEERDTLQNQLDNYECDCLSYYECERCSELESDKEDLENQVEQLESDKEELEGKIEELEEEAETAQPLGHIKEQVDQLWKCLALPSYNKEAQL